MSKAEYMADLRRRLVTFETRLQKDKARLAGGEPREKVTAAGDLVVVERYLAETKSKLAKLEAEPEGAWENFKAEMEEDFGHLAAAFDRWVARQEKP